VTSRDRSQYDLAVDDQIRPAIKTTPLMTLDEAIQAMRKSAEAAASYRPPGG